MDAGHVHSTSLEGFWVTMVTEHLEQTLREVAACSYLKLVVQKAGNHTCAQRHRGVSASQLFTGNQVLAAKASVPLASPPRGLGRGECQGHPRAWAE